MLLRGSLCYCGVIAGSSPLIAVPITVLLYNGPWLCDFNVATKD